MSKIPRRTETSESAVPFQSSEPSSSEIQETNTTAFSGNPSRERLYLSMTEEGPTGEYKMTTQRDRHGRWMPTKGERTMNIQQGKRDEISTSEEARNTELFRLRRPRQAHCIDNFTSVDGTPMRYPGNTFLPKSKRNFRKQSKPNGNEYSISRRADVIREKHRERVTSSRLLLRWKKTDTGWKAKGQMVRARVQGSCHTRD